MMLWATLAFGAFSGLFCLLLVAYSFTGPYSNPLVESGVRNVLNTLGWLGALSFPLTVLLWLV